MERLTNKREADAQREEYERRLANGYPRNIPEARFLRLAAYEDTGLTPEEIKAPFTEDTMINLAAQALGVEPSRLRELAEADKDGRVIILPCKVYETDGVRVYEHTVREVIYETAGGPAFDKNAIGKSIFLTREEAERASRETQGKEDADGATDKPE